MVPMKKTLAPFVSHSDSKGRKFMNIVSTAYDKAELLEGEAQNVNEASGLADLIAEFITKNRLPKLYADEEVASDYIYPEEYKGPKSTNDQIRTIAEIFNLDSTSALEYAKNLPKFPEGAEGWFAIPSVDALSAKYFPEITDPNEKYCAAVRLVLEKIAESRNFHNYREGQINPAHFRIQAETAEALKAITEIQKGDILIIATQLGLRHRGRSSRRVRAIFAKNEFGLNSLAMGAIALVHPERFAQLGKLDVIFAGDELSSGAAGCFGKVPGFCFYDGEIRFGASDASSFGQNDGVASAFLPQ